MRQNKQTKTKQKAIKKGIKHKNEITVKCFYINIKFSKSTKNSIFFNNCHYIFICRSAA